MVDSLLTIRKLKEKNVAVVFEKEGVNTLDGTGEILITILSSLAQEESRNISENTRWGVVRRFENGKMIVNHNKYGMIRESSKCIRNEKYMGDALLQKTYTVDFMNQEKGYQ